MRVLAMRPFANVVGTEVSHVSRRLRDPPLLSLWQIPAIFGLRMVLSMQLQVPRRQQ